MSIKKFLFSWHKNKKASDMSLKNPYVKGSEGRREWNDRYMDMAKSIRNWQLAFASAVGFALIMSFAVLRMATESKIQPFVVETCQGMPTAFLSISSHLPDADRLVNYAMNQFIINARTIVSDTQAQTSLLNKVYAYSADNTLSFLHDYYQKNNPFNLASQYTNQITILNSMQISPSTWQITWDETKKSASGSDMEVTHWIATMTYRLGDINPKFITDNPFGIYVTEISWSQISE